MTEMSPAAVFVREQIIKDVKKGCKKNGFGCVGGGIRPRIMIV